MATRDLTGTFLRQRSANIIQSPVDDHDQMKLMDADEIELEERIDYNKPGWQRLMEIVQHKMDTVKGELVELNILHNNHTKSMMASFKDDDLRNDEDKRLIEAKTSKISNLLRMCKGDISCLEQKNTTKEVDIIFNNLKIKLVSDLNELMKKFRKDQQYYLVKLKEVKLKKDSYGMDYNDDDLDSEEEEDEQLNALALDRGFTQEQKDLLMQNQRDVLRRDKELREVLKSITELHEMFEDLNALIVEQGSMLDRIDYNIQQASRYMKKSKKNVQSAETAQKASGWILCFILIIVIGILAAVGIAIKIGIKYIVK
mmetsp:Transcript_197/g.338  ORF Transcript_197/g.338 Transcript_197/m.338 type:complete len:314 (-) Transcript_197:648-1589(-)|eukprot:CAMPEP_0117425974 /NCGR_PEP_ID=MMETSP0758-20121206/6171_1 /TAXON_ID=63605 /ORGANISM="Percolomonas cosmopolitus, Strain AE-1 (ATCC 50343)" /LENGTH=313 /DNA_ID=CAMNT_0005210845 /DNA_START=30 /DNA_END=971 /DNA_ORIENTATION=-